MKQVFKCDYCSHTGNETEISQHEGKCSFNPIQKICWTCIHRREAGAPISGYWNECKKEKQCYEVEDAKLPCELWENETLTTPKQ